MRKKIVLLPLDERPCNMFFSERLFSKDKFEIVRPKQLGDKKQPADIESIKNFLKKECKDADGLVLSIDTLLYGGLIPSRIHHETAETLLSRMEIIKEIRKENPKMLIYAFQVIMRCPSYSSSDEEPDYYEKYGEEIHKMGEIIHKSRLGEEVDISLAKITEKIDQDCLNDYIGRREINRSMNVETLDYLANGWIDALVIPQDDSAMYGYAAMDQKYVRDKIEKLDMIDQVLMYPGADEVELTLLSRMENAMNHQCPKVYIKYISEKARDLVPLYEGMTLSNTLKYHILSAGCQQTESYEQADIILIVTAPADHMEEAVNQPSEKPEYHMERNFPEMIEFIKARVKENKIITIADNAYANGGDLIFIHLLDKNKMLTKVNGYAGWNTSANTIGTAIAQGVNVLYAGETKQQKKFLIERYIEDGGYCGLVRKEVSSILPEGMDYFDIKEKNGEVSQMIKRYLEDFCEKILPTIAPQVTISKVENPWRRMFEIDIEVECEMD